MDPALFPRAVRQCLRLLIRGRAPAHRLMLAAAMVRAGLTDDVRERFERSYPMHDRLNVMRIIARTVHTPPAVTMRMSNPDLCRWYSRARLQGCTLRIPSRCLLPSQRRRIQAMVTRYVFGPNATVPIA